MKLTLRGILAATLVLAMAALFVRLGLWQLDRLEQRRARNAVIVEAQALPPLRLDSATLAALAADPERYVERRVRVRGTYDPAGEVVLRGRAREGRPGVHLVTPLRVEGSGVAVMVERGWVSSPDAASVDPRPLAEPGVREVEGILRAVPVTGDGGGASPPAGGRPATWRRLDLPTLRERAPYPVLPLYVQQLPGPALREPPFRIPPPEPDEGPHLGYALQWFSFAAIALVGLAVLLVRGRRPGE